jgi:peptide/nickel transport system substrate-binding protein
VNARNGGPLAVQTTCQILPPTMPGYRPYCPYTVSPSAGGTWTAPNLALAQRLVRKSGTRGDRVTLLYPRQAQPFPSPATARYVVSVLRQLGYQVSRPVVKNPNRYWSLLGDSRARVQAGFFSRYQDYPAPSDFIDPLFTCGSFVRDNPGNLNDAEFCDPRIDAQARRALSLEQADPAVAVRHALNQPDHPGHGVRSP